MRTLHTYSAEQTRAVGRALGERAQPGTVIALEGDLGAGKTVLAKGIGDGLAVATRVTSPTFILLASHGGGRLPLWHADLYRLGDASEIEQLGLDEILEGDGVVVVEWAERFPEILPTDHLRVKLDGDGDERTLVLEATGPRHRPLEEAGGA